MPKIFNYRPERGFGFVQTDSGRAFLHATAISQQVPRGIDLNGRELVEVKTETGPKGLRVTSAELTPINTRVEYSCWSDTLSVTTYIRWYPGAYERSDTETFRFMSKGDVNDSFASPIIDREALKAARKSGVPSEAIRKAIHKYFAEFREWAEKRLIDEVRQHALSSAAAALKEQGSQYAALLLEKREILIKNIPDNDSGFIEAWDKFVTRHEIVGENEMFFWVFVPKNSMVYYTGGHKDDRYGVYYGNEFYYQTYYFRSPSSRYPRVHVGAYEYGMGGPTKGGRYGAVGRNPNDPGIRNRD